ncbi:MAG: hypothetical protein LBT00_04340 [Spirochaetaceae bacterium]|nr:hypothetical protein [Spirochaetaceae bacterium]
MVNILDNKVNAFLQKISLKIEVFAVKAGDKGLTLLWCGIFSLIVLLLFLLSAGPRTRLLENEVNKALLQRGDGRSLNAPITPWRMDGSAMQLGSWWTLNGSESIAVAFPVIRDGIFAPFLAIIGTNGAIELVPLTRNAAALHERLAPGVMDFYTSRLQRAAEKVIQGKNAKEGRGNAR